MLLTQIYESCKQAARVSDRELAHVPQAMYYAIPGIVLGLIAAMLMSIPVSHAVAYV
jgi:uncharacterized protein YacL